MSKSRNFFGQPIYGQLVKSLNRDYYCPLNHKRSLESRYKRKSTYKMDAGAFVWTSLGLNQGPPDYESVALTN